MSTAKHSAWHMIRCTRPLSTWHKTDIQLIFVGLNQLLVLCNNNGKCFSRPADLCINSFDPYNNPPEVYTSILQAGEMKCQEMEFLPKDTQETNITSRLWTHDSLAPEPTLTLHSSATCNFSKLPIQEAFTPNQ